MLCENLFWAICEKVLMLSRNQAHVPEELEGLEKALSDTYFCNFSMFQSVPDAWAVDQLFPICPIHRLNEEPTRRATLADITCDSDGKIDSFIDLRDVKHVLELHPKPRARTTTSASSSSARTRRSSATCTTCSATPTPCTSSSRPRATTTSRKSSPATPSARCSQFVDYSPSDLLGRLRNNVEHALRKKLMTIE